MELEKITEEAEKERRLIKLGEEFGTRGINSCQECKVGYYVNRAGCISCWNCGYNPRGNCG